MTWLLASVLLSTGAPALATSPPQTHEVADDGTDRVEDEDRQEADAQARTRSPDEALVVQVGLTGLWGQGPAAAGRLMVHTRTDAYAGLDTRVHHDGRLLGRARTGLDVLGGGRAHLTLGAFGGATRGLGKDDAALRAQGGGELGLGYDDARVGLGWHGRLGVDGLQAGELLWESEVQGSWSVSRRVALTGTWLRTSGQDQPQDLFGAGVRASF